MSKLLAIFTFLIFAPIHGSYLSSNLVPQKFPWNRVMVIIRSPCVTLISSQDNLLLDFCIFWSCTQNCLGWLTWWWTYWVHQLHSSGTRRKSSGCERHCPTSFEEDLCCERQSYASQESAPPEETVRRKYPTRWSQGIFSQPVDVDSQPSRHSTSKFFSKFVSSKKCDQLLQLPPDQQMHQAASHFAQVLLLFLVSIILVAYAFTYIYAHPLSNKLILSFFQLGVLLSGLWNSSHLLPSSETQELENSLASEKKKNALTWARIKRLESGCYLLE